MTNDASARLALRLAALARSGETETYGALARDLGLRVRELTDLLEATMAQDIAHDMPIRAAVCRGRLSDTMPARGFFDTARALGVVIDDTEGFVRAQRDALRRG